MTIKRERRFQWAYASTAAMMTVTAMLVGMFS